MERAAQDDAAIRPAIVLRVVIRSPDLETFVSKYSRFVKDNRIFIFTKSSQPLGTRVRFTLELADGQPLINGEGTVTRIRPDVGDASKPPGMELLFAPLDEASQQLVQRMLAARGQVGRMADQQTAPIVMGTESQPIAISDRFRDESTDVDDDLPLRPPALESRPVLEPLQKTGRMDAIADEPGQDESGAVTLSQGAPVGARPPPVPRALPPPLPQQVDDRPSGNFLIPTPLPQPIPAGADDASPVSASSRLDRLAPTALDRLTAATRGEEGFAPVGPAPAFAEAFRAPLDGPGNGHAPPENGTVPANPFSEVSDGAIEYFVEWSLEQSTAPRPRAAASSFANVVMATPRREKRRSSLRPLLVGLLLGLAIGAPLGGISVWLWRPMPVPVIVETMPQPPLPEPVASKAPSREERALPAVMAKAEPKPSPPPQPEPMRKPEVKTAAAETPKPIEKPVPKETSPAKAKVDVEPRPAAAPPTPVAKEATSESKATVQIASHPTGAAVSVDGEARGKTPVTLQLPSGAHEVTLTRDRYAPATQTVEAPGKLDVTLHRPTATLHVDSDPPGGDVSIEGKPRGKTPVDVTLEAFHHYDVQVTLLGTRPFKKRVSLKPPQIDVNAKLEVVHK
jgi:hypothetical protein